MAFPFALVASALGAAGSIFGKQKQGINWGDLSRLRQLYDPLLGLSESGSAAFIKDAFGRLGQNTYLNPQQYSQLFRQLTDPGMAALNQQYGQGIRGLSNDFANRGQLFGGSLTGAQAGLGAVHQQALSDLFSNVGGQLGTLDLQLGSQRQLAAQQALNSILQQLLGQEFNLTGYAKRG